MAFTETAGTILAVDFGTASTRASLFDVVEGVYRFVAGGEAPSSVEPPYLDAAEGMRQALHNLQQVTGRQMLDDDGAHLMMPMTADGHGCDSFVATASAGPAVRALLVGLLPEASVESARRTAMQSYIQVVETISLGDRRREGQMLDAILAAKPELVFITGGTDNGASDAVLKLTEIVALAFQLLPRNTRLKVLYAGNPALAEKVDALLGGMAMVKTAPNVQPELGEEVLGPARHSLGEIFDDIRSAQIGGFSDIAQWAGGHIRPTAQAAGQTIRFLSRTYGARKAALGVDVGSASTVVAAAFDGELILRVRPDLGLGLNAAGALAEMPFDQFLRWLPFEASENAVREFVLNKAAYAHTIPADENDLYFEHALAREIIRAAVRGARPYWPPARLARSGRLPWFDCLVGSGAVLGSAPKPGLAALLLLDALQPAGVTSLLLDQYHLTAALGAIAYQNPVAVAQLIGTGTLLHIGTALAAVGSARPGEVVGKARLVYENGTDLQAEIRFGTIEVLPLPPGQVGKLTIQPRLGFDFGFGSALRRSLQVEGGAAGVMIDARGRPIQFPASAEKRYEAVRGWIWKASGL